MKSQANRQQLEIFPLQPGTNPARPEGERRRGILPRENSLENWSTRVSTGLEVAAPERFGSTDSVPETENDPIQKLPCWNVAQQAWSAVAKFRANRNGVATTIQQGAAVAICQPVAEEDAEQLTPWEQVLSAAGFLVFMALVVSGV